MTWVDQEIVTCQTQSEANAKLADGNYRVLSVIKDPRTLETSYVLVRQTWRVKG